VNTRDFGSDTGGKNNDSLSTLRYMTPGNYYQMLGLLISYSASGVINSGNSDLKFLSHFFSCFFIGFGGIKVLFPFSDSLWLWHKFLLGGNYAGTGSEM
jgi:hypothetical protein